MRMQAIQSFTAVHYRVYAISADKTDGALVSIRHRYDLDH
jgi:hypothetical protein